MTLAISLGDFYGIDSIIDLLILITSAFVAAQSNKIYHVTNERNYRYFSAGFLMVSAAFFFKIVSNLTLIHAVEITGKNLAIVVLHELGEMQIFHFIAFTAYKALMIAGFLTFFLILTKSKSKEGVVLFSYFAALSIFLSIYFNTIFHINISLIAFLLTLHFYQNYKIHKTSASLSIYLAFLLISAGSVIAVFSNLHYIFYLLDEFILFVGFSIILYTHLRIKNDKKTNKTRDNKRHPRHTKQG